MRRLIGVARRRLLATFASENELASYVNVVYQQCLGRSADAEGLQHYIAALRNGTPFSALVQEVMARPEAQQRREDSEKEFANCVNFVYRHCLGRAPEPHGLQHWTAVLRNGTPLSQVIEAIEVSPEAQQRRLGSGNLDELSDGEFILNIAELLFEGRGAAPADIERWRKYLNENRRKRSELIKDLINAHIARQCRDATLQWNPYHCWIMGTERYVTPQIWQDKATQLDLTPPRTQPAKPVTARREFKHSGDYVVSAIASLYKGRRFLENFLEMITSQTTFDRSELIVIDANSPEGEAEIVADYQKTYPNIVYKRIDYRIGVYDAWNIGVQLARGRYLTNTNVDDLRRRDSFELQAGALDRHRSADVVYQDVFYSLDGSLRFDEIARFDFKSELPIVTPNNLLVFNSPHNAPMWRKSLHQEVGLFDTSFKSAGDWEFWLRCLWKGKSFFKINTPHVAYFQNPEGLSTRPDTRGIEEGREVLHRYSRKLISARLLMSRQKFADLLEITPDWNADMCYYDVVQGQLRVLGERHKTSLQPKRSMTALS